VDLRFTLVPLNHFNRTVHSSTPHAPLLRSTRLSYPLGAAAALYGPLLHPSTRAYLLYTPPLLPNHHVCPPSAVTISTHSALLNRLSSGSLRATLALAVALVTLEVGAAPLVAEDDGTQHHHLNDYAEEGPQGGVQVLDAHAGGGVVGALAVSVVDEAHVHAAVLHLHRAYDQRGVLRTVLLGLEADALARHQRSVALHPGDLRGGVALHIAGEDEVLPLNSGGALVQLGVAQGHHLVVGDGVVQGLRLALVCGHVLLLRRADAEGAVLKDLHARGALFRRGGGLHLLPVLKPDGAGGVAGQLDWLRRLQDHHAVGAFHVRSGRAAAS